MATTNTTTRKDFDFEAYNAVMKGANAGLKLFLANQMMSDIATTAFRYRNPLAQQLMDTADEIATLRTEWKAISEKSQKQTAVGTPNAPVAGPTLNPTDTPVADSNLPQVEIA